MNTTPSLLSYPWVISCDDAKNILSIVDKKPKHLSSEDGRFLETTRSVQVRNDVAIIPIRGPIVRFENIFTSMLGGTSLEMLSKDFRQALESDSVKAIILDIDSPGGQANGINEMAKMIFNARDKKSIHAFIGGTGTSAAYWLASAASSITIDESAIVGGIGTVVSIVDESERDEKEGIKRFDIVSKDTPLKRVDPTSDEGRTQILKLLDSLTDVFVSSIAKFRGVSIDSVKSNFGKGGVFVGSEAIKSGLVDRTGSFEDLVSNLSSNKDDLEEKINMENEINFELINKEYSVIANAFRKEGELKEKKRIKEIDELSMSGNEKLINQFKYEMDITPEQAAILILKEDMKRRNEMKSSMDKDADELKGIDPSLDINKTIDPENEMNRHDAVTQMVLGSKARQGGKN